MRPGCSNTIAGLPDTVIVVFVFVAVVIVIVIVIVVIVLDARSGFEIYEVESESAGFRYCCSRGVNLIKMERVSRAFEEYAICRVFRYY